MMDVEELQVLLTAVKNATRGIAATYREDAASFCYVYILEKLDKSGYNSTRGTFQTYIKMLVNYGIKEFFRSEPSRYNNTKKRTCDTVNFDDVQDILSTATICEAEIEDALELDVLLYRHLDDIHHKIIRDYLDGYNKSTIASRYGYGRGKVDKIIKEFKRKSLRL